MAEPILTLDPTRLSVEPGGVATAVLTVFNPGTVVEGYDLDVVGTSPMPWATIAPPTLSVYPQQEATAIVTFSPPSGPGAPGGSFAFGVRARSQVDAAASAVVEGDIDLGTVSGLQAKLTPVTSKGRWRGRHVVEISNWGNAPARLRILPRDPDEALGFLAAPDVVDVPLGTSARARLKVRTRHPILRGTAQRLPFQVVCEPEVPDVLGQPRAEHSTPERPVVDGAFNQKPILTPGVVALAGLLVAGLLGGLGWLLFGPEEEPVADALPPAQPTNVAARATPGIVVLGWDRDQSVARYQLQQTAPVTSSNEVEPFPDPGDDGRSLLNLEVDRAATYCFRLAAMRGDLTSTPTDQVCVESEAPPGADPTASPTASPTVNPLPAPTSDAGGPIESPTNGESSTAPPTTPPEPEGPLPVVTILKLYTSDLAASADTDAAALSGAGVPAKVLLVPDFVIDPALPAPFDQGLMLYVDGNTVAEAQAACQSAEEAQPETVTTDCGAAWTRQVTPASTSPAAPTLSLAPAPTPTA